MRNEYIYINNTVIIKLYYYVYIVYTLYNNDNINVNIYYILKYIKIID